nr:site-2 protease family protein [Faecalibacterium prausnitzii]
MSFIVTFIAAVFVFSAVIAIHEFGHFMVAKLCGVQVNEFSIGMGPVLCKRVRKGTQYSIRALPVGGFVALEGEESPESKQAEERSNPSAADGGSSPDRGALGIAETSPRRKSLLVFL